MTSYQRPPKLSHYIAEKLKEEIIRGYYLPGERLKILDLAKRFQVSQSPVREALKILERSDLVTEVPHKGYVVTCLSLEELMDIWTIKEFLWPLAFRWFAERANSELVERAENCVKNFRKAYIDGNVELAFQANFELTDIVLEGCGSKKLVALLKSIEDQVKRYRYLTLVYDDNLKMSSHYFGEIITAIKERNLERVYKLTQSYVSFSKQVLNRHYKDVEEKMRLREKKRERVRKEAI